MLKAMVLIAALSWPCTLVGQRADTRVMVRVIAHDAKIIGSGVGGARVTIRDAASGRVLAQGIQAGSTGDTRQIMTEPRVRGASIYTTEGAAGFEATISLSSPTLVRVQAEGPLGTPHALRHASLTTLLVPGQHVEGDGIVLELLGFTVLLEAPSEDATVPVGEPVTIQANVTMLCGCPFESGGLWDADRITVMAQVIRDGRVVHEAALPYGGAPNTFRGRLTVVQPGPFELRVLAMDAERANFGMVSADLDAVASGVR